MEALYIFISFIAFYLSYKMNIEGLKKGLEKDRRESYTSEGIWVAQKEFWIIIITTLAWFAVVPAILMWKSLDYITNKFNLLNKNQNEKNS